MAVWGQVTRRHRSRDHWTLNIVFSNKWSIVVNHLSSIFSKTLRVIYY